MSLTNQIKEEVLEKDLPSNEVLDIVQQKIYHITSKRREKEFKDAKEVAKSTIEHILDKKGIHINHNRIYRVLLEERLAREE